MKTRYIILVAFLLGINSTIAKTTAQSNNSFSDSLIVKIQDGHFSDVAKRVEISDAESFLKYCKRNGINKSLQDSVCHHICKYYAGLGYWLSFEDSNDIKEWTDALHFAEKHLGRKDSLYWYLLDHQTTIFERTNNFKSVDSCLVIKLKYQKKVLGENHPDCINTMQKISWINYLMLEQNIRQNRKERRMWVSTYVNATSYAMYAKFASMYQYGQDSPEVIDATLYESTINYLIGSEQRNTIITRLNNIYKYYQKHMLNLSEHYFDLLTFLVYINIDSYKYSEVNRYVQEMVNIANTNNNTSQLFLSKYFMGYYYQLMGNYKYAEEYYDQCLQNYNYISRTPLIYANPPEYNIARFYHDIGDYDKSDTCARIALKNAHFAADYGRAYMIQGENAIARQEYEIAQQLLDKSYNAFSCIIESKTANAIWSKLAKLAYLKGNCEFALKSSDVAVSKAITGSSWDVNIKEFDTDVYELFVDRLYYAKCMDKGWTDEFVEEEFTNARSVYQKSYGTKHNKYAELLYHYARWTNNVDSAVLAIQDYLDIYHTNFIKTTSFLSEKQRTKYWQTIIPKLEDAPLLMWRLLNAHPELLNTMYNNELFSKGALLKATNQIAQSIMSSGDSVIIADWERLTWLYENLEYQKNKTTSNVIQNMQKEAELLEKKIVAKSSEYRQDQKQWSINVDSVKKYLPSDAFAIEFLIIPEADKKWHCALLLRNNYKHPEVIVLFEEKEVSSFLSSSEGNITNQTYDYYANGATISKLVWSKILPKIKEGETIYFAPSGLLHQLAIEYLPYDENRTMSDVYNVVRLSSTREIVLNKQNTKYTTATIYGGIAYDLEEDVLLAESENYTTENLLASRSIENDTLNRGNVKYLPGTKKEAESINALLKQNNISAKLYTTAKANEESFKALSGKHSNILHIGTHGFTWTDSVAKKQDFFTQRVQLMGQEQHYDTSIDPLNRCGLLFAGANIALQGNSKNLPEGVQDGILTAKEISLMDLRDANLVVLSACETAKGDITSEGVFGLQRAFKMAGVQTIIMSLWKVNDQATQLLMTEFYNNWIGKHQSKREAFRSAQNTVRTQYEEPEYWAGFIMLD